jgi:hypothetical protein
VQNVLARRRRPAAVKILGRFAVTVRAGKIIRIVPVAVSTVRYNVAVIGAARIGEHHVARATNVHSSVDVRRCGGSRVAVAAVSRHVRIVVNVRGMTCAVVAGSRRETVTDRAVARSSTPGRRLDLVRLAVSVATARRTRIASRVRHNPVKVDGAVTVKVRVVRTVVDMTACAPDRSYTERAGYRSVKVGVV